MFFKQIKMRGNNFAYIIADENTKEAAVVDPGFNADEIKRLLDSENMKLLFVINTHDHVDHVLGDDELSLRFGAKTVAHQLSKTTTAVRVDDGDVIRVGNVSIKVIYTPGHSADSICLLVDDKKLLTGDTLFVGSVGNAKLSGGDSKSMYDSLFNKILKLPAATKIHPGHDYEGNVFSYLHEERRSNPFLQPMTEDEYVRFVADFFPPVADAGADGKVTLQCGVKRVSTTAEGFRDIPPKELAAMIRNDPSLFLLDVREPFELIAFGAIHGVRNISINEIARRMDELPADKAQPVVVVCQSGSRSYEVAHHLVKRGYTRVYNLDSGTSGWIMSGNPVMKGAMKTGAVR